MVPATVCARLEPTCTGGWTATRDGCTNCKDDLLGTWYDSGMKDRPSYISERDNQLTFTNYFGLVSKGRCVNSGQVEATDWEGGLKGNISDDRQRINWVNNTYWTR